MKIRNKEQCCQLVTEQEQLKQQQQYWESRFLGVGCVVEVVVGDCSPKQFDEGDVNNRILRNLFYLWILQSLIKCPQVRLFLAVHNSSIGDLVTHSLTNWLTVLLLLTLQSDPRDLWPLRHLIRVMRKHDLTHILTICKQFGSFDKFYKFYHFFKVLTKLHF